MFLSCVFYHSKSLWSRHFLLHQWCPLWRDSTLVLKSKIIQKILRYLELASDLITSLILAFVLFTQLYGKVGKKIAKVVKYFLQFTVVNLDEIFNNKRERGWTFLKLVVIIVKIFWSSLFMIQARNPTSFRFSFLHSREEKVREMWYILSRWHLKFTIRFYNAISKLMEEFLQLNSTNRQIL